MDSRYNLITNAMILIANNNLVRKAIYKRLKHSSFTVRHRSLLTFKNGNIKSDKLNIPVQYKCCHLHMHFMFKMININLQQILLNS